VAQEQEQLLLTQKQRDRLKVLHEVKEGHLTQKAAGEQLGMSERWVRELGAADAKAWGPGRSTRVKGQAVEAAHRSSATGA
jgi:hypothetical protein